MPIFYNHHTNQHRTVPYVSPKFPLCSCGQPLCLLSTSRSHWSVFYPHHFAFSQKTFVTSMETYNMLATALQNIMYLNKYWSGWPFLLYFLVSASYNLTFLYHFVDLNTSHSICDGLENPGETGTLFGKYRLAGPLWRSSWFSFPRPKFSYLPSHPTYYPLQTPNSDMVSNWGLLLFAGPGDRTRFTLPGLRCYTWVWKCIFSPVSYHCYLPFLWEGTYQQKKNTWFVRMPEY